MVEEIFGMIFGLAFVGMGIVGLALYVYLALALQTIAKRLNHEYPWLAWIPFANIALVLQLGGFHWALVFLAIIPIVNIAVLVLLLISLYKIADEINVLPPWTVFLILIPFIGFIWQLILMGILAWKK